MAVNLGTAYIRIAPRLDGVSNSIKSALTGGASSSHGLLGNILSSAVGQTAIGVSLGKALYDGVKAIASKISEAISEIISAATEQMDSVIRTKVALKQMGYSEEEVARNLDMLRRNANKTAADFGDLADGFLTLTASWKDINLTADATKALSDAILAMGGTPEMVANAITQIGQVDLDGPLDGETWRSLRNSGLIPVLSTIAEMNGLSLAQYKEELGARGELTTRNFIEGLVELDKQGNETQNSLEKIAVSNAAATWSGSWEAAKENVTSSLAQVMESVWSASGAGQMIIDMGDKIGDAIPKVVETVKNSIKGFLAETGLDKILPKWMEYIGKLAKLLAAVVTLGVGPMINSLIMLWNILKPILNVLSQVVGPIMEAVGNAFEWLADVIFNTIGGVQVFFNNFFEGVKIGLTALEGVFRWFGEAIHIIFAGVSKWFGETFGGAIEAIKKAFSPIVQWFKDRWNDIKNVFKGVRDLGKNIVEGLWNGINDMTKWIYDKIKGFGDSVLQGLKDFFGIHSPSTLMAKQGQFLVQGFAKGILDSASYATDAIDEVSEQMLAETMGARADMSMALNRGAMTTPIGAQANTQPQVVQNNTFNQVADDLDVKEASRLLGFEVATAI